jgi:hypothetical protein
MDSKILDQPEELSTKTTKNDKLNKVLIEGIKVGEGGREVELENIKRSRMWVYMKDRKKEMRKWGKQEIKRSGRREESKKDESM